MAKWYKTKYLDFSVSIKAALGEFLAMTMFVFIGCGTAVLFSRYSDSSFISDNSDAAASGTAINGTVKLSAQDKLLVQTLQTQGNWGITTALAFGMAIVLLVYTFGHISGGQVNCAVTLGLVLAGHLGPLQGIVNFIFQMVGSCLGAGFLYGMLPNASGSSLGANSVAPDFNDGQAFLGEAFMTFCLVFVVLMTATDPRSIAKVMAPFAIGMTVFVAHTVLLPVDGCSINPTRSFGPALVSGAWSNYWVFWVGPIVGSIVAVPTYFIFRWEVDTVKGKEANDEYETPAKAAAVNASADV